MNEDNYIDNVSDVEKVDARLTRRNEVFDNELTQRREIWTDGVLTLTRPRSACGGMSANSSWGYYREQRNKGAITHQPR